MKKILISLAIISSFVLQASEKTEEKLSSTMCGTLERWSKKASGGTHPRALIGPVLSHTAHYFGCINPDTSKNFKKMIDKTHHTYLRGYKKITGESEF